MPRGAGGGGGGGGSRGYKGGHKGQRRHFTNPDDLVAEQEKQAREKQWRKQQGQESEDEDGEDGSKGSASESESSSSEEDIPGKSKGVEGLIEVENPNRVVSKNKKVSQLDALVETKPELSRKEREEIEKQRAKDHYQKLHAAGKTDDARADLARLALIKQQREVAAKKRDEEIKAREVAAKTKSDNLSKALGKNKKT